MDNAQRTTGQDTQPDPDAFRNAMPPRIADMLSLVQTLTTHGRRISGLITRPTTWIGFVIIARFFGAVTVPDMAAQIQRGLMRLSALEAMLLHRAQRGQDLVIPAPRTNAPRTPRATVKPPHQEPPKPLTLRTLPTQQETRAWVRRRPIGRVIAAIILDLGVAPAICRGTIWTQLSEAINDYRGSVTAVIKEVRRRVEQSKPDDCTQKAFPWPKRLPKGVYRGFDCYIGQDPFPPAPAAIAGPS